MENGNMQNGKPEISNNEMPKTKARLNWKIIFPWMLSLGLAVFSGMLYLRPLPEPVVITLPPPVVAAPVPTAAPVALEVEEPAAVAVAQLLEFKPRVTFRRQKEMAWEEALMNLPLFRMDAVRTYDNAGARISFLNGSIVDMIEESLLIINPGASQDAPHADRLLMRRGNLKAQTKKELWILTTAALFRIKPQKGKAMAKSTLAVEEGKKIRVEISEGEGLMLKTTTPGKLDNAKPVRMVINKPVVIAAPTVPTDFGFNDGEVSWPDPAEVEVRERELASLTPPTNPKIPLSDFVITSPPDYSEVMQPSIELKGRVTGKEATLSINGKPVELGAKRDFRATVRLAKGANAILIQLNRSEGTPLFRRWTVIRRE